MTPPRPAALLLLAAALAVGPAVAGCAGPGGAADDRGERSGQIRLGTPISSPSTSGTRDFVVRAFADCPGPCHADAYRLVFSNVGQSPLNTSFAGVTLEVDGRTYSWDNGERGFLALPNTYGEFLSVSVPRAMFEDVASAESVRVVLGDYEFYLSPGKRGTLADLVGRTSAGS